MSRHVKKCNKFVNLIYLNLLTYVWLLMNETNVFSTSRNIYDKNAQQKPLIILWIKKICNILSCHTSITCLFQMRKTIFLSISMKMLESLPWAISPWCRNEQRSMTSFLQQYPYRVIDLFLISGNICPKWGMFSDVLKLDGLCYNVIMIIEMNLNYIFINSITI